ncbi:hypothetical protein [Sporomusa malonica]|uniref:Uncharacterized protein n=1 Tax=Sporomusa malonica TaxID=112901 RepID=A0A1W1Z809_9FIRM|nr:hypothetical protein [Sporomusa malonica]SMC44048.1 hypothetical protein SAMN04488500_10336 [Sporomusa malonica]
MDRNIAGLIGGVIGGVAKLVLDQLTFASGISSVDTIGTVSNLLSVQSGIGWFIYAIATGFAGWLAARLISQEHLVYYFSSGSILGIVLWVLMNIFFIVSGVATPTWLMGTGSFVINLISHLVLGIVIAYTISNAKIDIAR